MVMCKTDMEGKTDDEVAAIWEDWRNKRSKKKIVNAYAEIVLKIEDSQLAHMCSHNPETVWDTLTQVHCACGLAMQLAL